jgi:lysosomal acid lipase/cholesteryl ester hydrolase
MCGRFSVIFVVLLSIRCEAIFFHRAARQYDKSDDVMKLIAQAGYKGEFFYVEPKDNSGWSLKMHRILPRGNRRDAQPVFLMHGLFAASGDYVVTGRNKALAYLLADNNYDVFMGNCRGNRHARMTRSANASTAWDFSFNEIGKYDIAAMIDKALEINGREKLFFIGHSQGTTSVLALLATRPEYNQKIIQAHLLAAVAFQKYLPNPLIKDLVTPLMKLFEDNNVKYLNLSDIFGFFSPIARVLCNEKTNFLTTEICKAIIFTIVGTNTYQEEIDTVVNCKIDDFSCFFR